ARGRLMQALPAGGVMVSVAASEARVREALVGHEQHASVAGTNSPTQTVISGEADAVAQVVANLGEGVRSRGLTVSHAFHSPLMAPIAKQFLEVVRSVRFSMPDVPVVSCVTGAIEPEAMCTPEYW